MVALKPHPPSGHSMTNRAKQERRGGIETMARVAKVWRSTWKQERRGGIETGHPGMGFAARSSEAGTPWWH